MRPEKTYIVAPVQQRWPFAEGVEVIAVGDVAGVWRDGGVLNAP